MLKYAIFRIIDGGGRHFAKKDKPKRLKILIGTTFGLQICCNSRPFLPLTIIYLVILHDGGRHLEFS